MHFKLSRMATDPNNKMGNTVLTNTSYDYVINSAIISFDVSRYVCLCLCDQVDAKNRLHFNNIQFINKTIYLLS